MAHSSHHEDDAWRKVDLSDLVQGDMIEDEDRGENNTTHAQFSSPDRTSAFDQEKASFGEDRRRDDTQSDRLLEHALKKTMSFPHDPAAHPDSDPYFGSDLGLSEPSDSKQGSMTDRLAEEQMSFFEEVDNTLDVGITSTIPVGGNSVPTASTGSSRKRGREARSTGTVSTKQQSRTSAPAQQSSHGPSGSRQTGSEATRSFEPSEASSYKDLPSTVMPFSTPFSELSPAPNLEASSDIAVSGSGRSRPPTESERHGSNQSNRGLTAADSSHETKEYRESEAVEKTQDGEGQLKASTRSSGRPSGVASLATGVGDSSKGFFLRNNRYKYLGQDIVTHLEESREGHILRRPVETSRKDEYWPLGCLKRVEPTETLTVLGEQGAAELHYSLDGSVSLTSIKADDSVSFSVLGTCHFSDCSNLGVRVDIRHTEDFTQIDDRGGLRVVGIVGSCDDPTHIPIDFLPVSKCHDKECTSLGVLHRIDYYWCRTHNDVRLHDHKQEMQRRRARKGRAKRR